MSTPSGPGRSAVLPTGWPDEATLERLANEWFATPSGAPESAPAGHTSAAGTSDEPSIVPADTLVPDVPLGPSQPVSIDLSGPEQLLGFKQIVDVSPLPQLASVPTATPAFYFGAFAGQYTGRADAVTRPSAGPAFDALRHRRDFPILSERINGRPLVWLDNAATTQKPQAVIDRIAAFYRHENSNIHRAAHTLAARATDAYEHGREAARRFLGARSTDEVVFVRGATEAINLVAQGWGRAHLAAGDEIIVSWLEHHANIVPWQQIAAERGARLRVIPVDDDGQVRLDEYAKLLGPKTKIVSIAHVSNALGTVTPVQAVTAMAKAAGARVLVDGAQAVSHLPVDVQALGADWYVFSGHKVFGPTGIGVLYGREDVLRETPPWQGGGNMIRDVTFERTDYQDPPAKFEAGTGNIADVAGLAAALDYVTAVGLPAIAAYEHGLLEYATRWLGDVPGLRLIGTAPGKAGVISFVLDGHRTEDIGAALDREGIAVRSGHHCAQPILRRFGVESTVRPSLAFYNTHEDVDRLVTVVSKLANGRSVVPN